MSRRRYRYSRRRHDPGLEAARRHIDERARLTRELGGSDVDVERYFLSLSDQDLEPILLEYGRQYGAAKLDYARHAIPRWRSGRTKMSGLVATRLFQLLPRHMKERDKYRLVERLWEQHAPRSSQDISFTKLCAEGDIRTMVAAHFQRVMKEYQVPASLSARFDWLSDHDTVQFQRLLNHFLNRDLQIALTAVTDQIAVVLEAMRRADSPVSAFSREIKVGGHSVTIHFDPRSEVTLPWEGHPTPPPRESDWAENIGCLLPAAIIIGIIIFAIASQK